MITNDQYKVLNSPLRNIKVRLEILDMDETVLDEIQGICTNGNFSIDAESPIRRQGNISISIDKRYLPINESSRLWLNRKMRPYIYINDVMVWDCGIFLLDSPSISYSLDSKEISLPLVDKMSLYTGDFSGYLQIIDSIIKYDKGTPIETIIKTVVESFGNESNYSISDCIDEDTKEPLVIPENYEKEFIETITSILDEIRDMFIGFEYFFDLNGKFIWQKIKDRKYDPVMWEFNNEKKSNFVISYQSSADWKNIKNIIQIWGKHKDDGTQIRYLIENKSEGEFCINKIGPRTYVYSNEKIFTEEQAKEKALYEYSLHSNLKETITIQTVPIYGLDVNNVIYIKDTRIGIDGNYCIKQISTGLTYDSTMSITAEKMYYED